MEWILVTGWNEKDTLFHPKRKSQLQIQYLFPQGKRCIASAPSMMKELAFHQ
jgi:hypothetical protein